MNTDRIITKVNGLNTISRSDNDRKKGQRGFKAALKRENGKEEQENNNHTEFIPRDLQIKRI